MENTSEEMNTNSEQNEEIKEVKNEEIKNEEVKNEEVLDATSTETKNTKEVEEKKEESYAGYNIFVFISAIIGFIMVMFFTRFGIDKFAEEGKINLENSKVFISMAVAVVAVIIFMFIALSFKKMLKKIFLSELFLYLYMGFLTTAVNIIFFEIIRKSLLINNPGSDLVWKVAEVLAFIISVIFAFVTNKLFVFRSYSLNPVKIFSEFGMFLGARLITEAINFAIMWFMIDKNNMDEFITKVCACVIVIVLNYIFSKFIIFKKKEVKN